MSPKDLSSGAEKPKVLVVAGNCRHWGADGDGEASAAVEDQKLPSLLIRAEQPPLPKGDLAQTSEAEPGDGTPKGNTHGLVRTPRLEGKIEGDPPSRQKSPHSLTLLAQSAPEVRRRRVHRADLGVSVHRLDGSGIAADSTKSQ
jgi:hypothetical protein